MSTLLKDISVTIGRFFLVILVLTVGLMIVVAIVQVFSLEESHLRTFVFNFVPFAVLLLGTIALVRFLPPRNTINAGLSLKNAVPLFFAGLALGAAWRALAVAILAANAEISFFPDRLVLSPGLAFTALAVLLNIATQQILTRGYLFGAVSWKFGAIAAIIVTSIFFAALHAAAFTAGPLAAINLLTAGLIFGFARAVTHSLWFAAGLHFVWNFTGSVVLGFLPAHYDFTLSLAELSGDALWIGGSFGIETGLAVAIANGVLLAGLIAWFALRTSRTRP